MALAVRLLVTLAREVSVVDRGPEGDWNGLRSEEEVKTLNADCSFQELTARGRTEKTKKSQKKIFRKWEDSDEEEVEKWANRSDKVLGKMRP